MSLRNPAQEEERNYRSVRITKIDEFEGNFLCKGKNKFLFWVFEEYGVQPSVGDIATFYDAPGDIGCFTRGLFIGTGKCQGVLFGNDAKCFYSMQGPEQPQSWGPMEVVSGKDEGAEPSESKQSRIQDSVYAKIDPERARAKERYFKWMKEKLSKQYEELPEFFQEKIMELREELPNFWHKFGNIEVFIAREATKLALVVPVKGAMELWLDGKYSVIEDAFQRGLDRIEEAGGWDQYNTVFEPRFSTDEHSTTTFRSTIGFASIFSSYLLQPGRESEILRADETIER